jgi:hypothetical protein
VTLVGLALLYRVARSANGHSIGVDAFAACELRIGPFLPP